MIGCPLASHAKTMPKSFSQNILPSLSRRYPPTRRSVRSTQTTSPPRTSDNGGTAGSASPRSITFNTFTLNAWAEPESPLGKIVDSPGTNQLFVLSDVVPGNIFPDGSTFEESGSSGEQFLSFDITFHDNACPRDRLDFGPALPGFD